jgi:hypothetical protein
MIMSARKRVFFFISFSHTVSSVQYRLQACLSLLLSSPPFFHRHAIHSFTHLTYPSLPTHWPFHYRTLHCEHSAGIAQYLWMTLPSKCHPEASAFQGRAPINRAILGPEAMMQTIVIGSGTYIYNEPEIVKVTKAGTLRWLAHSCTKQ